jgi:hypothetical protein
VCLCQRNCLLWARPCSVLQLHRVTQNRRCGMLLNCRAWLLPHEHCGSVQLGVTCPPSLQSSYPSESLPTLRSCCDLNASGVKWSWSKLSKYGWTHRQQTSLTQAYKNPFPYTTSDTAPEVTRLRSSLRMYLLYIIFFSSLFLLTAQWRLFSK